MSKPFRNFAVGQKVAAIAYDGTVLAISNITQITHARITTQWFEHMRYDFPTWFSLNGKGYNGRGISIIPATEEHVKAAEARHQQIEADAKARRKEQAAWEHSDGEKLVAQLEALLPRHGGWTARRDFVVRVGGDRIRKAIAALTVE